VARTRSPLPPSQAFIAAGVYAIYYTGDFPLYRPIAEQNGSGGIEQQIYVGKAVPAGARAGGFGLGATPGTVLYGRLAEHGESIREASNLELDDFYCRYLAVDDIWIPLGEALLIETFSPIWNMVITGFGIHDPGAGRANQRRSMWDVIHPGRPWAAKLRPGLFAVEEIEQRVEAYYVGRAGMDIAPET
jgi:Eco29kI restriction endonuclease